MYQNVTHQFCAWEMYECGQWMDISFLLQSEAAPSGNQTAVGLPSPVFCDIPHVCLNKKNRKQPSLLWHVDNLKLSGINS